jgi:hypothetical protein
MVALSLDPTAEARMLREKNNVKSEEGTKKVRV